MYTVLKCRDTNTKLPQCKPAVRCRGHPEAEMRQTKKTSNRKKKSKEWICELNLQVQLFGLGPVSPCCPPRYLSTCSSSSSSPPLFLSFPWSATDQRLLGDVFPVCLQTPCANSFKHVYSGFMSYLHCLFLLKIQFFSHSLIFWHHLSLFFFTAFTENDACISNMDFSLFFFFFLLFFTINHFLHLAAMLSPEPWASLSHSQSLCACMFKYSFYERCYRTATTQSVVAF